MKEPMTVIAVLALALGPALALAAFEEWTWTKAR
jgi:hypothetical protein